MKTPCVGVPISNYTYLTPIHSAWCLNTAFSVIVKSTREFNVEIVCDVCVYCRGEDGVLAAAADGDHPAQEAGAHRSGVLQPGPRQHQAARPHGR